MRPRFAAVLGLTLAAGLAVAGLARAEEAQTCEVPAYLLTTESVLSRVAETIKNARPLNVLVVGSRSSTINSSEASAYPAKLQEALKERLPSIPVNLSVEIQAGKTAEDVAHGLVKLVEEKKPTLVVWQTGTVDAMRSVDPDDFRGAVNEGVVALQKAGADVTVAENGQVVVALVDEQEVTLKRLRRRGNSIALEPANPRHDVRIFPADRVKVQGRLVALLRRY
jgi:hypothetical protein